MLNSAKPYLDIYFFLAIISICAVTYKHKFKFYQGSTFCSHKKEKYFTVMNKSSEKKRDLMHDTSFISLDK